MNIQELADYIASHPIMYPFLDLEKKWVYKSVTEVLDFSVISNSNIYFSLDINNEEDNYLSIGLVPKSEHALKILAREILLHKNIDEISHKDIEGLFLIIYKKIKTLQVMAKVVLGIRSNKWDYQTYSLYTYYSAHNINVVVILDSVSPDLVPDFVNAIYLDHFINKEPRLNVKVAGYKWRCGDLFFYALQNAYPDYDGYWLIEDDALMYSNLLYEFLHYPFYKKIDLYATNMGEKPKSWIWHGAYSNRERVFGCSFGFVFCSNVLLSKLFKVRLEFCDKLRSNEISVDNFPGDEALFMNECIGFNKLDIVKNFGSSLMKNYHFTSSGKRFVLSFVNQLQFGLYHPIIIDASKQQYDDRLLKITTRQQGKGG